MKVIKRVLSFMLVLSLLSAMSVCAYGASDCDTMPGWLRAEYERSGYCHQQFSPSSNSNDFLASVDFNLDLSLFANTATDRNFNKMLKYSRIWSDHAIKAMRLQYNRLPGTGELIADMSTEEREVSSMYDFIVQNTLLDTNRLNQRYGQYYVWEMTFGELYQAGQIQDPYTLLCDVTNQWSNGRKAKITPYEFCVIMKLFCDAQNIPARILVGYESMDVWFDRAGNHWLPEYTYNGYRYRSVSTNVPCYVLDIKRSDSDHYYQYKRFVAHPRLAMLANMKSAKYEIESISHRDGSRIGKAIEFPIWQIYDQKNRIKEANF